jgi:hypothetical protein
MALSTTLSIADSSVLEPTAQGTVNLNFTVTRSGDLTPDLTVGYTTIAGTAQPGTDFTPTTGVVTFTNHSPTAIIGIPIFNNGVFNNPSLSFSVQLTGIVNTFATGPDPNSVAVGDVNGDNKPYLVVANKSDNTVSVLLNMTPSGATHASFAPQQTFDTGSSPISVAVGGVNGDNKPDLVVANNDDNAVSVLLNNQGTITRNRATGTSTQAAAPLPPSVTVAFGPFGEVLELVSSDGTLIQSDVTGAQVLGGGVRSVSVAFGPAGEVLLVTLLDGTLTRFDASGAQVLAGGVLDASIAFGPTGQVLLVTLQNGTLVQADSSGARVLAGGVLDASIASGPAGQVLLVTLQNGTLLQFDRTGAHTLGSGIRFASVAFNQAGEVLDLIVQDRSLAQFDATGARVLARAL